MTNEQPKALRLADVLEKEHLHTITVDMDAAKELRRLHQVEKERDVLLGIFEEHCKYAEWSEKVVWGCNGSTNQHCVLEIYLPVPLDEPDKTPEAALKRFIDNTIAIAKVEKKK